jgi:hypothetical protein
MVTKKQQLDYLKECATKSKALPAKELQAKRLKATDKKIEDLKIKMNESMQKYKAIPSKYTDDYNKLIKLRNKIEKWEV